MAYQFPLTPGWYDSGEASSTILYATTGYDMVPDGAFYNFTFDNNVNKIVGKKTDMVYEISTINEAKAGEKVKVSDLKSMDNTIITALDNAITIPEAKDTLIGEATLNTLTNKTLTTPIISSMYQDAGMTKLMTLPDVASDTFCMLSAVQSLTNKTFQGAFIDSDLYIKDNIDPTKTFQFNASLITTATNRIIDIPNYSGELTMNTNPQDFRNKYFRDNYCGFKNDTDLTKIVKLYCTNITTGTTRSIEFPNANGTLVLADNVQTIVNKTLSGSSLLDATCYFIDNVDPTKRLKLFLDAITTGTTRQINIPNQNGILLLEAGIQNISNKSINDNAYLYGIYVTTTIGTNYLQAYKSIYLADCTTGNQNITLYDLVTYPQFMGRAGLIFVKTDATANTLTLNDVNNSINGSLASVVLNKQFDAYIFYALNNSSGINWICKSIGPYSLNDNIVNSNFCDQSDRTKKMNLNLSGITTGNTHTLTVPNSSGTFLLSSVVQEVSNKNFTIGNTFIDTGCNFINTVASTKQFRFNCENISIGTVRVLEIQDADGKISLVDNTETLTNKTLTTPIIASIYQDAGQTKLMTLPDTASDTLAAIAATQTLTNKTLTTPIIASIYQDAGQTKLMTIPNTASDTLTAIAATQTLTNKTLTTPIIASIYQDAGQTKLLSLPAYTGEIMIRPASVGYYSGYVSATENIVCTNNATWYPLQTAMTTNNSTAIIIADTPFKLTIVNSGLYKIDFNVYIGLSGTADYVFVSVQKNDLSTVMMQTVCSLANGAFTNVTIQQIMNLAATDYLKIVVQCPTQSGNTIAFGWSQIIVSMFDINV